jgi:hypothetical protein
MLPADGSIQFDPLLLKVIGAILLLTLHPMPKYCKQIKE